MHPDWLKFMEQYKEDPHIVVAELNMVEFRKEAEKIMRINGYPTYAIVTDGVGTSISVARTTKDFCAKAEEIKAKYSQKNQGNFKCHMFYSNNEQYPFMTLLSSCYSQKSNNTKTNNNIIKSNEDTCKIFEEISERTNIDLNNFFINQTKLNFDSKEYISNSNSIVIAKAFLNPIKTVEYKINFNLETNSPNNKNLLIDQIEYTHTNNSNFVTEELIYDIDSLSLFAKEYLVYKQFGDWDIVEDENATLFAFKESSRRLLLFVFESSNSNQPNVNDESISNQVAMKYKATVTNNAEFFLASKISSNQLLKKFNVKIQPDLNSSNNSSNEFKVNLIVSDSKKSKFALIKNIQSKNFSEIVSNIKAGLYDDQDDKELEPLKNVANKVSNLINQRSLTNQRKKRKSPFAFFAIGYFVCALIITIVMIIVLVSPERNSNDSKSLIEHNEIESDTDNQNDATSVLNIEDDENDQDEK